MMKDTITEKTKILDIPFKTYNSWISNPKVKSKDKKILGIIIKTIPIKKMEEILTLNEEKEGIEKEKFIKKIKTKYPKVIELLKKMDEAYFQKLYKLAKDYLEINCDCSLDKNEEKLDELYDDFLEFVKQNEDKKITYESICNKFDISYARAKKLVQTAENRGDAAITSTAKIKKAIEALKKEGKKITIENVIKETGLSYQTVRKILKELKEKGEL